MPAAQWVVELDPAGQARQVTEAEATSTTWAERAKLLLWSMGEKKPTGQSLLANADSIARA